MTPDEGPSTETGPASRASPVGAPVIRRNVTDEPSRFDTNDDEMLAKVADRVRHFAENTGRCNDHV